MGETGRSRPNEFTSLAERMVYMQGLRAGFAAVALIFTALASHHVLGPLSWVGAATIAYLGITVLAEFARRRGQGRRLSIVGWMLLLDGVYIAWLMYLT